MYISLIYLEQQYWMLSIFSFTSLQEQFKACATTEHKKELTDACKEEYKKNFQIVNQTHKMQNSNRYLVVNPNIIRHSIKFPSKQMTKKENSTFVVDHPKTKFEEISQTGTLSVRTTSLLGDSIRVMISLYQERGTSTFIDLVNCKRHQQT